MKRLTRGRWFTYYIHSLQKGAKSILVRTVDTDVGVILVGIFYDLIKTQHFADIWLAFGMGKHYRFYHINALCASLEEQKSRSLPVFHSFSGCDTTSAFKGKSKKSVWEAWRAYQDVTDTFVYLATHPFQLLIADSEYFKKLERLTLVLYDRKSTATSINLTRKEHFCQKTRAMDKLPPTEDALSSTYVRRACSESSRHLDNEHTNTANNSFPTRFCLE